jgi:hypothetical protein
MSFPLSFLQITTSKAKNPIKYFNVVILFPIFLDSYEIHLYVICSLVLIYMLVKFLIYLSFGRSSTIFSSTCSQLTYPFLSTEPPSLRLIFILFIPPAHGCQSRCPRVLRRGSAAACLLGLRVRIPPVAWMPVCCECCVLSGRGVCEGLITSPEESYRL